jgi:putative SOS response-associated peptidase YedK
MCNLYRNDPTLIQWAEAFEGLLKIHLQLDAGEATLSNQPWAKEVYPKYQGLFARPVDPTQPAAGLEPAVGRWGLVPFYHKGPAKAFKLSTNNARSETMATSGTFKFSVKDKRCIIPASAIFEWTGEKGSKTKHAITAADGSPLFLAGLWARHKWEDETAESYTMVMQDTAPGDDMHVFHDRQPVFLDAASARKWLDLAADPMAAIKAPPPGALVADPPTPAAA